MIVMICIIILYEMSTLVESAYFILKSNTNIIIAIFKVIFNLFIHAKCGYGVILNHAIGCFEMDWWISKWDYMKTVIYDGHFCGNGHWSGHFCGI